MILKNSMETYRVTVRIVAATPEGSVEAFITGTGNISIGDKVPIETRYGNAYLGQVVDILSVEVATLN